MNAINRRCLQKHQEELANSCSLLMVIELSLHGRLWTFCCACHRWVVLRIHAHINVGSGTSSIAILTHQN
ncbi:hypothetical protein OK016_22105 [Vibrio chagasii]|nr:hypothetical protein [Vibrio chagasii]